MQWTVSTYNQLPLPARRSPVTNQHDGYVSLGDGNTVARRVRTVHRLYLAGLHTAVTRGIQSAPCPSSITCIKT